MSEEPDFPPGWGRVTIPEGGIVRPLGDPMNRIAELQRDLAAVRGDRDRLREALERLERLERLETVARGLEKDLRNAQLPWFAERLRAALEKANG